MAVRVEAIRGDITEQRVDAIVNAANSTLYGGGGVDGAIHRRGGPAILAECRRIRAEEPSFRDGLPTGEAVATTAGDLPARWVIHTVGPVYARERESAGLLARCHTRCLEVAAELGAGSVVFPAISTGAYGYPIDLAAPVAVGAVRSFDRAAEGGSVELVRFVLFDGEALAAFQAALTAAD